MKKNRVSFTGRDHAGFTLLEIMIALAISGALLAAVYVQFKSQQESYLAQDQVVEMQQNLRATISYLSQDLRMAGYDPYCSGAVGIKKAEATRIEFTYVADNDLQNNDGAGVADDRGELETVTFDWYVTYGDGDKGIGRQTTISPKAPIAEHIENMEFQYLDSEGNVTANLNNIKAVRVSLLARSGKADLDFTNTRTYTAASGTVWGPYNDGFRRRFQIVTIYLRNMEI